MYYCQVCHQVYETEVCPVCGHHLEFVKADDACFLIEKKEIWAEMLKEILENHHIPYYYESSMGAGVALKVGPMLESYQFYVPYSHYQLAQDCILQFFHEQ